MRSLAWRSNVDVAEDVYQKVALALLRRQRDGALHGGNLEGLVRRMARRQLAQERRETRNTHASADLDRLAITGAGTGGTVAFTTRAIEQLHRCEPVLARHLTSRGREIVRLVLQERQSFGTLSRALKVPVTSVKKTVASIRRNLSRVQLDRYTARD